MEDDDDYAPPPPPAPPVILAAAAAVVTDFSGGDAGADDEDEYYVPPAAPPPRQASLTERMGVPPGINVPGKPFPEDPVGTSLDAESRKSGLLETLGMMDAGDATLDAPVEGDEEAATAQRKGSLAEMLGMPTDTADVDDAAPAEQIATREKSVSFAQPDATLEDTAVPPPPELEEKQAPPEIEIPDRPETIVPARSSARMPSRNVSFVTPFASTPTGKSEQLVAGPYTGPLPNSVTFSAVDEEFDPGHKGTPTDFAWVSPTLVLVSGEDGNVSLWDMTKISKVMSFAPYDSETVAMMQVLPTPATEGKVVNLMTLSETSRLLKFWRVSARKAELTRSMVAPPAVDGVEFALTAPVVHDAVDFSRVTALDDLGELGPEPPEEEIPEVPELAPVALIMDSEDEDEDKPPAEQREGEEEVVHGGDGTFEDEEVIMAARTPAVEAKAVAAAESDKGEGDSEDEEEEEEEEEEEKESAERDAAGEATAIAGVATAATDRDADQSGLKLPGLDADKQAPAVAAADKAREDTSKMAEMAEMAAVGSSGSVADRWLNRTESGTNKETAADTAKPSEISRGSSLAERWMKRDLPQDDDQSSSATAAASSDDRRGTHYAAAMPENLRKGEEWGEVDETSADVRGAFTKFGARAPTHIEAEKTRAPARKDEEPKRGPGHYAAAMPANPRKGEEWGEVDETKQDARAAFARFGTAAGTSQPGKPSDSRQSEKKSDTAAASETRAIGSSVSNRWLNREASRDDSTSTVPAQKTTARDSQSTQETRAMAGSVSGRWLNREASKEDSKQQQETTRTVTGSVSSRYLNRDNAQEEPVVARRAVASETKQEETKVMTGSVSGRWMNRDGASEETGAAATKKTTASKFGAKDSSAPAAASGSVGERWMKRDVPQAESAATTKLESTSVKDRWASRDVAPAAAGAGMGSRNSSVKDRWTKREVSQESPLGAAAAPAPAGEALVASGSTKNMRAMFESNSTQNLATTPKMGSRSTSKKDASGVAERGAHYSAAIPENPRKGEQWGEVDESNSDVKSAFAKFGVTTAGTGAGAAAARSAPSWQVKSAAAPAAKETTSRSAQYSATMAENPRKGEQWGEVDESGSDVKSAFAKFGATTAGAGAGAASARSAPSWQAKSAAAPAAKNSANRGAQYSATMPENPRKGEQWGEVDESGSNVRGAFAKFGATTSTAAPTPAASRAAPASKARSAPPASAPTPDAPRKGEQWGEVDESGGDFKNAFAKFAAK